MSESKSKRVRRQRQDNTHTLSLSLSYSFVDLTSHSLVASCLFVFCCLIWGALRAYPLLPVSVTAHSPADCRRVIGATYIIILSLSPCSAQGSEEETSSAQHHKHDPPPLSAAGLKVANSLIHIIINILTE